MTIITDIRNYNVAQNVAQKVGNQYIRFGMDDNILTPVNKAVLVCPSHRYLLLDGVMTEHAANTLAYRWANGRLNIQIEGSEQNILTRSQEIDHVNWTKVGNRLVIDPNIATDPIGDLTVDKATPTIDNNTHFFRQTWTPDGSSTYIFSLFAEDNGYDWVATFVSGAAFPGSATTYTNVKTGVFGTIAGAGLVDYGKASISNGFYWIWWTMTSNLSVPDGAGYYVTEVDNVTIYAGDGIKAVNFWQLDAKIHKYPTSPILSVASATTRSPVQLSWAADKFNKQVVTNNFMMDWTPQFKSHFLPDGGENINLFDIRSPSGRLTLRYVRTSRILELVLSAGANPTTAAMTFDWQQKMIIVGNASEGSIRVLNAVTGAVIGDAAVKTPWSALYDSAMTFTLGALYDWSGSYADSILSLPYN